MNPRGTQGEMHEVHVRIAFVWFFVQRMYEI